MTLRTLVSAAALLAALGATVPTTASAVTLGQLDTFTSLTVEGWISGPAANPVPPFVAPTGGPAGGADPYLVLRAVGGSGPGSRLTVINEAQWTGDYVAAGIAGIRMDLTNLGSTDLSVRLLIAKVPPFSSPSDQVITPPVQLPSGSGWTRVVFSLAPDDLITLTGDPAVALAGATEVRIFHGVAAAFPPLAFTGSLGVDNLEAVDATVPAASTSWGRVKRLYR